MIAGLESGRVPMDRFGVVITDSRRSRPRMWCWSFGVNGAGKTTSIAKLAHAYQEDGKSVHPRRWRHVPRCRD